MKAWALILGVGVGALAVGGSAGVARAQASPYLAPGSWEAELVERLRGAGVMGSLAPLRRPYSEAEVLEALRGVDTLRLHGVERHWYRELARELLARRGPEGRRVGAAVRLEPGIRGGTAPTLDPFVVERSGGLYPAASGSGAVWWRWAVAAFEGELTRREAGEAPVGDPGGVAFRIPAAYVRLAQPWGELVLGRVRWELGSDAPESLVLGPRPEPVPALAWSLGVRRFRFRQVISRLDRIDGERRYLSLHRVEAQPVSGLDLAVTEVVVWSGRRRGWELGFLNPVVAYFSDQVNDVEQPGNVKYALDVAWRPRGRVELYGQLLIDDLTWEEGWPHRLGGVAGVRASGVLPGISFEAHVAQASALLYQAVRRSEAYVYRGQGIASNRTDFERRTLRLHWDALPGVRLSPVYERLRQGPRNLWMAIPRGGPPPVGGSEAYTTERVGLEGFVWPWRALVTRFSVSYLRTEAGEEAERWRAGGRIQGWLEVRYRWGVRR